jgi:hypothetical protein
MKTLSTISLSLMLAACGGTSGSSDSISQGTDIMVQAEQATYKIALNSCGNDIPNNFSNTTILGSNSRSILIPSKNSELLIMGNNHNVCIGGGLDKLTIEGDNNSIFIQGVINQLIVNGSNQRAFAFDDVMALDLAGSNNSVWLGSVATYTDIGQNNNIMNIINSKL